jgi:hypothetical protein
VVLERLTQCEDSLTQPDGASLKHEEVVVDYSVMRKPAQRSDLLHRDVILRSGVVGIGTLSDAVDLLVPLRSMMIPVLTTTRYGRTYLRRMPRSDTGNLSATTMRLTLEELDAPTLDDTTPSMTLGHSNDVDELVRLEHLVNRHLLLEFLGRPVDLVGDASTVELDLHKVGLLNAELDVLGLGVGDHTHDGAELLDAVQGLADGFVEVLLVLREGSLLGANPVSVEPTLDLLAQMLSPCGHH